MHSEHGKFGKSGTNSIRICEVAEFGGERMNLCTLVD